MEVLYKMKYPNALKGIKKIYTSQILTLLAGILSGTLSVLGDGIGQNAPDSKMALLAALFLGFAAFTIIAYLLNLVGTIQAGKDESSFKNALLWIVIGIALTVIAVILGEQHSFYSILTSATRLADILTTVCIIQGVISLAKRIGNEEQAQRGKKVLNMIIIIYALSFVLLVVSRFFGAEKLSPMILGACGLVALVLLIIAYITFLKLLSRARKMLEKE